MLYNAQAYERPTSIEEARRLLQRADLRALALYDDLTTVEPDLRAQVDVAVDLGGLEISGIDQQGASLRVGGTTPLQSIIDGLSEVAGGLLVTCAHQTAGWHVRRAASIGGLLTDGAVKAPIRLALDALEARVEVTGRDELIPLKELSTDDLTGEIILAVNIDLPDGPIGTAYEQVGRTPKDLPIVNAVAVVHSTGMSSTSARVRIGGVLANDLLRLDLNQADWDHLESFLDNMDGPLLDDQLGSAEYRLEMARVLSRRVLADTSASMS